MLERLDDLVALIERLYPDITNRPKKFSVLAAIPRLLAGEPAGDVAKAIGSSAKHLRGIAEAPDPVKAVLGASLEDGRAPRLMDKAQKALGSMLVGYLAERAFEQMYKEVVGTDELKLEDDREERTDTDYRVLNGRSRPVFRLNIKFHGGEFRQAQDLVGLDPNDCFPLATYKIKNALDKQVREHLPYLFVVVGVRELPNVEAGAVFPEDFIHLRAVLLAGHMSGKRDVEDRMVAHLVEEEQPLEITARVERYFGLIQNAGWRVISARKADRLLRALLFERVFAVRIRAFTSAYRNAEVDMHFSISQDLTPLQEFLDVLRDHGLQGMTARLERGTL